MLYCSNDSCPPDSYSLATNSKIVLCNLAHSVVSALSSQAKYPFAFSLSSSEEQSIYKSDNCQAKMYWYNYYHDV